MQSARHRVSRRRWQYCRLLGFAVALVFGFAMTRCYDRTGLHRMVPTPS
ncbi:hypothetical protein AB0M41_45000 [Streptomyces sp. NPDC051896]